MTLNPSCIGLCLVLLGCGATSDAGNVIDTATPTVATTTLATTPLAATPQQTPATSTTEAIPLDPSERPLPGSAAELSAELSTAELMVRDQNLTGEERAGWGRRQQRLYRHLATNDEWADDVLTQADPRVATAIGQNWLARRELSSLTTSGSLSSNLPAWNIRAPLPAEELLEIYRASEQATGIGWEYLAAINLVETRMGRIEGLSTAGATGPMQFLPSTWEECCEGDPTVDGDAILGAATYLVDRGGPDDMERALRGYNNSGYYVVAVSAYAEVLRAEPTAYDGYHAWEVFFRSDAGLVRLPVGYYQTEPLDAALWIATNPQHLLN